METENITIFSPKLENDVPTSQVSHNILKPPHYLRCSVTIETKIVNNLVCDVQRGNKIPFLSSQAHDVIKC